LQAATEEKSKTALANSIRNILQTDIKFEKLSKEELQKLYSLLTNMQSLAIIGVNNIRQRLQNRIQTQILDRKVGEIIQDERLFGGNGLLGLGILGEKGILGFGIVRSLLEKQEEGQT
jgi:hypothetical protein